jgi:DNA-binding NtrC family response regulator
LARVSGFIVRLPPLRERIDDLGILVAALLSRHALPEHPRPTITIDAMRVLVRHDWPLNVRELEHCLRAALALSPERIDVAHLPESVRNPAAHREASTSSSRPLRTLTPEQLQRRDELRTLLAEHHGNISQVARLMGKDRVQIRRWIRQYALSTHERAPT